MSSPWGQAPQAAQQASTAGTNRSMLCNMTRTQRLHSVQCAASTTCNRRCLLLLLLLLPVLVHETPYNLLPANRMSAATCSTASYDYCSTWAPQI
jgi:hypothetical protein